MTGKTLRHPHPRPNNFRCPGAGSSPDVRELHGADTRGQPRAPAAACSHPPRAEEGRCRFTAHIRPGRALAEVRVRPELVAGRSRSAARALLSAPWPAQEPAVSFANPGPLLWAPAPPGAVITSSGPRPGQGCRNGTLRSRRNCTAIYGPSSAPNMALPRPIQGVSFPAAPQPGSAPRIPSGAQTAPPQSTAGGGRLISARRPRSPGRPCSRGSCFR